MAKQDDEVKAQVFNQAFNSGLWPREDLDRLAKKALAIGDDRQLTEISRTKADIDRLEAECRKDEEINDHIFATGDIEAMKARTKELQVIDRRRHFRIFTWQRLFPTTKQGSS